MQSAYAQGLQLSSQGRHLEAISCFEQALALKPNDAATLFALGNTAHALGMCRAAAAFFHRVLNQEPGRIEALVQLGNLLRQEGRFDDARALLEPALERHPANPDLLVTLGSAHREAGDAARAEHCYRAALEARAGFAPALSNLADLLADEGHFDQAQTLYDQALKASFGHPQVRLNRAILHFLTGHLKEGWQDYAARSDVPNKVPVATLALPEWRGENLPGGRLLVRAEQGVGDQLMFMSVVPDLLAQISSVILECDRRLVPLAARSFPQASARPNMLATINGVVTADYGWLKAAGGASSVCLLGSLPKWLRKVLAEFPKPHAYLVPDPAERAHWKKTFTELAAGPAIGLCWRSGSTGGHRSLQYAPLAAWGEFLKRVEGTLVSCQYDARPDEIAQLESASGRKIVVPAALDQKNDLDRTAAMLSALDMVVSAPTAVSWLAAGAGVATLKLLYDRSWTSFGEAYEPLAPACRCVMPKSRGDWRYVFEEARAVIAEL